MGVRIESRRKISDHDETKSDNFWVRAAPEESRNSFGVIRNAKTRDQIKNIKPIIGHVQRYTHAHRKSN